MTARALIYNQLVTIKDDDIRNKLYLLIIDNLRESDCRFILDALEEEKKLQND